MTNTLMMMRLQIDRYDYVIGNGKVVEGTLDKLTPSTFVLVQTFVWIFMLHAIGIAQNNTNCVINGTENMHSLFQWYMTLFSVVWW